MLFGAVSCSEKMDGEPTFWTGSLDDSVCRQAVMCANFFYVYVNVLGLTCKLHSHYYSKVIYSLNLHMSVCACVVSDECNMMVLVIVVVVVVVVVTARDAIYSCECFDSARRIMVSSC